MLAPITPVPIHPIRVLPVAIVGSDMRTRQDPAELRDRRYETHSFLKYTVRRSGSHLLRRPVEAGPCVRHTRRQRAAGFIQAVSDSSQRGCAFFVGWAVPTGRGGKDDGASWRPVGTAHPTIRKEPYDRSA